MAPVAITSSLTSPPGVPVKKSQIAAMNSNNGLNLDADGSSTPYSTTSTAVSEYGDSHAAAKVLVEENVMSRSSPDESGYYANLLKSSAPLPTTKPGSTTFGSAIDVLQAFAVSQPGSVWVYDDAVEVGFGAKVLQWNDEGIKGAENVFASQTREGAGFELAGYAKKTSNKISVFASLSTLPLLLPSLEVIDADIIIHLATTVPNATLELTDALSTPGVVRLLANLPSDWDVVFSSGAGIVSTASKLYGTSGKVIHVVESTYSGREITSYKFPSVQVQAVETFSLTNSSAEEIIIAPAGSVASDIAASLPSSTGLIQLHSLSPDADALASALSTDGQRKTVKVIGGSRADAEALKAVVLSALYSASGSSKSVLPIVKAVVATSSSELFPAPSPVENTKTISFYSSAISPLPELMAHLFLSSPTLHTRLAQFGSATARGVKSVLSLAPANSPTRHLPVDSRSDVVWVSDANVLKHTDVLHQLVPGGIFVIQLPWTEEEVPVKLTRSEITTIKEKNIRVFLLDLDPTTPLLPLEEQVAFLLLYTGKQRLPMGVRKVLDAFHSGHLGREPVEAAQAGLLEATPSTWQIPELEEGKIEKTKSVWEWDALAGEAGIISLATDEKPVRSAWDLAARHLLFREAFAVPDSKTREDSEDTPGIAALRPSMTDETFLVTVSENRRLTPETYDRNVFHLELDTAGTGLKYDVGEAIGIHGWNDTVEVLDFCKWYGLDPDSVVTFPNPLKAGTMESRTVYQLLQQNIDLFGRPGKAFYAALSKLAKSKTDAMTLKFIASPEGAELFKKMAEDETVTFADVLGRFKTARPGIEELVGLIPEIKPRHYSIASSQKAVGDKVELLIVTVDWINSLGEWAFPITISICRF